MSRNGRSESQSSGAEILLIDDDSIVSRALDIALRMAGHRADAVASPEEAYSRLARRRYDAILLDLNFTPGRSGGEEGLACLQRLLAEDPAACVVVITAHGGIRIAVEAMRTGASDFAVKPWRNAELVAKVEAAIARRGDATETPAAAVAQPRLLGESEAMKALRDLVSRVAPTAASVTVTGPPGSGRTLTAMAIHAASRDAAEPPLRIDLRDEAAWEALDQAQGTAILRHPDRLDPISQARLLDRLDPGLRCIGIADALPPLSPALRRRIATAEIPVPPLDSRGEDKILLARHFAASAAERFGRPAARLTPAAEAAIRSAVWPDEVRGLALQIERAVLLAEDGLIGAAGLALPAAGKGPESFPAESGFGLEEAERAVIAAALREHRHNVTRAAAALGLSRGALYRRMARHGL